MIRISIVFFILAVICAILGFGGAFAVGIAVFAKIMFFIFLAVFILCILFGAEVFRK